MRLQADRHIGKTPPSYLQPLDPFFLDVTLRFYHGLIFRPDYVNSLETAYTASPNAPGILCILGLMSKNDSIALQGMQGPPYFSALTDNQQGHLQGRNSGRLDPCASQVIACQDRDLTGVAAMCRGIVQGRDGLLDGNRTHISRLGGACTIHYATRRSGRILARRGARLPISLDYGE
jgi:hypothetical protein